MFKNLKPAVCSRVVISKTSDASKGVLDQPLPTLKERRA
jgi:hypothetical protein